MGKIDVNRITWYSKTEKVEEKDKEIKVLRIKIKNSCLALDREQLVKVYQFIEKLSKEDE